MKDPFEKANPKTTAQKVNPKNRWKRNYKFEYVKCYFKELHTLNEILNEPDVTKESDELKNDKPEKKENIPKKKKVLSRRNLLFIKGRN